MVATARKVLPSKLDIRLGMTANTTTEQQEKEDHLVASVSASCRARRMENDSASNVALMAHHSAIMCGNVDNVSYIRISNSI